MIVGVRESVKYNIKSLEIIWTVWGRQIQFLHCVLCMLVPLVPPIRTILRVEMKFYHIMRRYPEPQNMLKLSFQDKIRITLYFLF